MPNALLLAEPEAETRGYLERHLAEDGFEVVGAAATSETLDLAERAKPDLVLLGIGDGSGLDLCSRLREGEPGRSWNRDVPVIVLGQAEADAVDRVRAFARGCDDYVPRPFVYDELVARIRAVLRRYGPLPHERLEAGEIVVDRVARIVTVRGRPVPLAAKEYELLVKLASEPTRVFTKEQLLRDVWGFRSLGSKRLISPRRRCLDARPAATTRLRVAHHPRRAGRWSSRATWKRKGRRGDHPDSRLEQATSEAGRKRSTTRMRAPARPVRTGRG